MKFLTGFTTEEEAKNISQSFWQKKENCFTSYKFKWLQNRLTGEWALMIPTKEINILSEEQQNNLIDIQDIDLENYFINKELD